MSAREMGKKSRSIEVPLCFDALSIADPPVNVDSKPGHMKKSTIFHGIYLGKNNKKMKTKNFLFENRKSEVVKCRHPKKKEAPYETH